MHLQRTHLLRAPSPWALGWWQSYRVDYYEPRGWVDSTIYNPDGYRAYRDAVYLNGAMFLEELRYMVGDDKFQQFLTNYVNQSHGELATAEVFFSLLDNYTDVDYQPLLDKYFMDR